MPQLEQQSSASEEEAATTFKQGIFHPDSLTGLQTPQTIVVEENNPTKLPDQSNVRQSWHFGNLVLWNRT